jgi:hypothetical protein
LENSDNYDPLTSAFYHELQQLPEFGKWIVQSEEQRSDILSNKIYGDPQYWWILLFYNNLTDNDDLSIGTVIRYPGLSDLEDLYFGMKARESAS